MIRPVDIQEKEFSRSVRGYNENEVNQFLDEITIDMERLIEDLRQVREENSRLVEELERYRGSEGTVVETLEAAKALMADISASAEKKADILLKNAELDAQLIKREAQDTADRLVEESTAMRNRFIDFRTRYKRLLESELDRFESLSGEMFPELGINDFADLPEAAPANAASTQKIRTAEQPVRRKTNRMEAGKKINPTDTQVIMRNDKVKKY